MSIKRVYWIEYEDGWALEVTERRPDGSPIVYFHVRISDPSGKPVEEFTGFEAVHDAHDRAREFINAQRTKRLSYAPWWRRAQAWLHRWRAPRPEAR